jgi:hypothetical protein
MAISWHHDDKTISWQDCGTDLLDLYARAEISSADDDLAATMIPGQVELDGPDAVHYFDVRHVERMVKKGLCTPFYVAATSGST